MIIAGPKILRPSRSLWASIASLRLYFLKILTLTFPDFTFSNNVADASSNSSLVAV